MKHLGVRAETGRVRKMIRITCPSGVSCLKASDILDVFSKI
jgi:hypothetical protein